MKFGHFYKGGSHKFDADPTVTDYLIESSKAKKLVRARKYEEALAIYTALFEDKNATPLQKPLALKQAANCARKLKMDDLAKELEARISE